MRPVRVTFTDDDLPISEAIAEDAINLDYVEIVAEFRRYLRADRLFYAVPREKRQGKAPRMPQLPSKTEFAHADAFAAL